MSEKHRWWLALIGKYLAILFLILGYSAVLCLVSGSRAEKRAAAQYAAEYEAKIQAFYDEQAAAASNPDTQLQAQIEHEADLIGRAIGPMATRRMKLSMLWNILVRVDSPYYDNTVDEVIAQAGQWMFYDEKNPIREDDRALALTQLEFWHEGRYPAELSTAYLYGRWSADDYVLRDTWEEGSNTHYWRFPENG